MVSLCVLLVVVSWEAFVQVILHLRKAIKSFKETVQRASTLSLSSSCFALLFSVFVKSFISLLLSSFLVNIIVILLTILKLFILSVIDSLRGKEYFFFRICFEDY